MSNRLGDDELDDRELPDESDMSNDFDATEPCPFCGKEVHEDADLCPHCGNFITRQTSANRPLVVTIGLIVLVVALLLTFLFSF